MRSKWLDWPRVPEIIEKGTDSEPTKPSKPSSVGFVGASPLASSITRAPRSETKLPVSDPYADRMQAALAAINQPDYPAGMIPWLGEARVDLYRELTEILPEEIHYMWSWHKPVGQFEQILKRFVETHRLACELYRAHLRERRGGEIHAG